jgi:quercetin dioxygenase-like cupin family protein
MLITRWQASHNPTSDDCRQWLAQEGLECVLEIYEPGNKVKEHRHPFSEIRYIVEGEMLFNVGGNQFLLRPGDRLEIPANTKHWQQCHGQIQATTLYAQRVF